MTDSRNDLAAAVALHRRGDLRGARSRAEAALPALPDDLPLRHFLGIVCCQSGDIGVGATHLGRALALAPDNVGIRLSLAQALLELGRQDEAEALCAAAGDEPSDDILRMHAYILQLQRRFTEAAAAYQRLIERRPDDFEAWNNLGNARREAGDADGAVAALGEAARLRPDVAVVQLNLGGALAAAGQMEDSVQAFSRAASLAPNDPRMRLEAGSAHAGIGELDRAEAAYREALRLDPRFLPAFLSLGTLFESGNRTDALRDLVAEAESRGLAAEVGLLRALLLRREGKLDAALAAARAAPATIEPARRAQLIGELADRLGSAATAFAAFEEMNRLTAEDPSAPRLGAVRYREEIEAVTALTTPEWFAGWSPAAPDLSRAAPVFLVGFPRSGTTLLDTVLMGHPDLVVLEETHILRQVRDELADLSELADLDGTGVDRLRARYFELLDALAPEAAGKLVIDKMPLNIALAPLVQRIFPDARFIFALRHPCDVVLSCFMTNFGMNYAMANFLDLGDTARLYDLVLGCWQRAKQVFPLRVHDIRYEAMVEDLEREVRPLIDTLGLGWDPAMLDHRATAARRDYIGSASYAQVTERLYTRATGRWQRYRDQMSPVLPLLAPWADRLGYDKIDI